MAKFSPCPPQFKSAQHYIKLAADYENRNPVISYWARLYALQAALKIDKKSPEAKQFLTEYMDFLEKFKKENTENEGVTSDVAGQAVVENEAHKLFMKADSADRQAFYDKNVVKAFYTAGILMDVCEVFGELTEELAAQRKYSKWKATYIHNCLKNGETPVPGPIGGEEDPFLKMPQPPSSGYQDDISAVSGSSEHQLHNIQQPISQGPEHPTEEDSSYEPPKAASYTGLQLTAEQFTKAQKYCKYAASSIDYEDTPTAIGYLQKALTLLTTGQDT